MLVDQVDPAIGIRRNHSVADGTHGDGQTFLLRGQRILGLLASADVEHEGGDTDDLPVRIHQRRVVPVTDDGSTVGCPIGHGERVDAPAGDAGIEFIVAGRLMQDFAPGLVDLQADVLRETLAGENVGEEKGVRVLSRIVNDQIRTRLPDGDLPGETGIRRPRIRRRSARPFLVRSTPGVDHPDEVVRSTIQGDW